MKTILAIATLVALMILAPNEARAQLVPIPGNPTLEPYNDINVQSCHECIDASCAPVMSTTGQLEDWEYSDTSGPVDAYEQIDQCVRAGWVDEESCLDVGAVYCYCGAQTNTQCINGQPLGPCADVIHQVFMGHSLPATTGEMQYMSSAFFTETTNAGDAMATMSCIASNCYFDCLVQE